MVTAELINAIFPNAKNVDELVEAMNELFPKYEIDTEQRVAGFLAQCGHESGGFRVIEENLNYSAKALDAVFGKYFVRGGRDAEEYHRQPEKIANVVYANRMDNGDTESGDGWRFRGRGYIQLTGRHNYTKFAESVDMDIEDVVDYLGTVQGALESACWYWDTNNLNKYCDEGDVKGMTKRINGGYIGLEDRQHHWELAIEHLTGEAPEHEEHEDDEFDVDDIGVLRKGARGEGVKLMQEALGIGADGVFGPGTERALKEWQSANGLTADGIAGPATLGELLG
jgi:putative chitinase